VELIETRVSALAQASSEEKLTIISELEQLCLGKNGDDAVSRIERSARSKILTVQWELEELIERVRPPAPPPEPEPEPETEDESDMRVVYNDPRGLVLHCNKDESRWLITQVDPRTRMPTTHELPQEDIPQIKMQLANSPHWTENAPA
jgi:hypothetical protein